MLLFFFQLPKRAALLTIRLWQITVSSNHGWGWLFEPFGRCKYHPSCSQYAYEAIDQHGLLRGGLMACWRLLRCNPFSKGGNDPVGSEKCKTKNLK